MKNFMYKSGMLALFAGVLLTSCDPEVDGTAPSKGEADFTTYVALGNSLTAGFQDGALYREGQENSYPAILAQQFQTVGGSSTFNQPLMAENSSAGSPKATAPGVFEVPQRLVLQPVQDCRDSVSLSPAPLGPPNSLAVFAPVSNPVPFNNLGVPGARSFHLLAQGYGSSQGNPFFARFATSPTTSVIADALAQKPTFFTLWIGNNDVLGYATAGGVGDQITPEGTFNASIQALLTQLTSGGAKGAVGNIPDVSKVPFFTTVPYNGLMLEASQAQALTAFYASRGLTDIKFSAGPNPFVVKENSVVRQLKQGEFVLLTVPQDSLKCFGLGSQIPIADKHILSEEEVNDIRRATDSFNKTLKSEADRLGLAYVDFNAYMNRLASGIKIDEVTYAPTMVTGNVFSLDGIHFTPRGAAIVANEFINAINAKYKANVPAVDITKYRAVQLP